MMSHTAAETASLEDRIQPESPEAESAILLRWQGDERCLVSVSMLAFNHEKYLRKALDGVLSQRTTFGFEILVHDDASSDDSVAIIQEYAQRYPAIVKPIYQERNQYSQGVYPSVHFNYPRANAPFVAICEGDDCWIDSTKLQRQVTALLEHPEVDFCFSQAFRLDFAGEAELQLFSDYSADDRIVPLIEIIHRRFGPLPTAACLIRRRAFLEFFEFLRERPYLTVGDLYFQFFGSLRGGAYYIARPMSVYRMNTAHSWSRRIAADPVYRIRHQAAMIRSYCELNELTQHSLEEEFQKLIVQRIFWLFNADQVGSKAVAEYGALELEVLYRQMLDLREPEIVEASELTRRRFVVYGAGSGCGLVMRTLTEEDVVAIVDILGGKVGQYMFNVPVISIDDLCAFKDHWLIVSTFTFDTTVFENLITNYGFDPTRIIYYYRRMVKLIDMQEIARISNGILERVPR